MKRLVTAFLLCCCFLFSGVAFAGHGHYTNGGEGLKAGTLPPEGIYWKMYNMYYTANRYKNDSSKKIGSFNVDVYAQAHRFIYSSDIELLGANLVFDVIVPLVNTNIRMGGAFNNEKFGVGDILVEPLVLAWHGDRYDAVVAPGIYLPTGYYDADNMASPGKGFWSFMFSGGGTLYLDEAKTWHAALVARYEIHTKQKRTNVTPGHDFHFEWGVGKTINQVFDIGVAGYCGWQVTNDSGGGSLNTRNDMYAVGPEIGFTIPDWGVHLSLRSLWEFENRSGSEGNITVFNITKAF